MNVSIANIIFDIGGNFTGLLSFTATYFVKLSNIKILGNSHFGCSSIIIMSDNSTIINFILATPHLLEQEVIVVLL